MADLLVVDDVVDVAEVLVVILESQGHSVRVARDGEAGLRQLRERVPDVLLVDMQMPKLDGVGMLARADAEGLGAGRMAVIVMTADANLLVMARQVGAVHVLTKPFTMAEALAAVGRALATGSRRRPRG